MRDDKKHTLSGRTLSALGLMEGAALGSLLEKRFGLVRSSLGGMAVSAAVIGVIAWLTGKSNSRNEPFNVESPFNAFIEPESETHRRSHVQRLHEQRQSHWRSR